MVLFECNVTNGYSFWLFTSLLFFKTNLLILQVSAFNAKVEPELHVDDESSIKWTDTSTAPPIIAGEQVSLSWAEWFNYTKGKSYPFCLKK